MTSFSLDGHPYIELHQLLKVVGLVESGGRAKILIAAGEVQVDGVPELRKRRKLRTGQVVDFAGTAITVAD